MNQPTAKHREEAREIRLPFPCGCLDAHEGGGMTVKEYTCETHRAIASALASRDTEIREVLNGLLTHYGSNEPCWCPLGTETEPHTEACRKTQTVWNRLRIK